MTGDGNGRPVFDPRGACRQVQVKCKAGVWDPWDLPLEGTRAAPAAAPVFDGGAHVVVRQLCGGVQRFQPRIENLLHPAGGRAGGVNAGGRARWDGVGRSQGVEARVGLVDNSMRAPPGRLRPQLLGAPARPAARHLEDVSDARAARQLADRHVLAAPVQHGAAGSGRGKAGGGWGVGGRGNAYGGRRGHV